MYIKRTLILSEVAGDKMGAKCLCHIEKDNNRTVAKFRGVDLNGAIAYVKTDNDERVALIEAKDGENECNLDGLNINGIINVAIYLTNLTNSLKYVGSTANRTAFTTMLTTGAIGIQKKLKLLNLNLQNDADVQANNCTVSAEIEHQTKLFEEGDVNETIANALIEECIEQGSRCVNCPYKSAFYSVNNDEEKITSNTNLTILNQDTIKNEQNENEQNLNEDNNVIEIPLATEEPKFYLQVKSSLDDLFSSYESDDILTSVIENSRFVKIDYNGDGQFYSVGIINEKNMPKYICYAIPSSAGDFPPKDMEEFSQWVYVDEEHGYWMTYQDAKTGENITF